LKPWYKVVTPREDLREGKPLDASEFAMHLNLIKDGKAPVDRKNLKETVAMPIGHLSPSPPQPQGL
jgi:hypothetical protein